MSAPKHVLDAVDALTLFHGAKRWNGPPEVRPAKSWRDVEHGPGFYLTSSEGGAGGYAKGGGQVLRFELDPDLRLLADAKLDAREMLAFLRAQPRLKHRADIEADIDRVVRRVGNALIPANTLVNLMVNYKVAHGEAGVALAKFYAERGIDADLVRDAGYAGDEDWYVLYNLDKVRRYGKR